MPGKIASAWVDIGAVTKSFDKAMTGVYKSLDGLQTRFKSLAGHASTFWTALAGSGGALAYAVKNAADEETAQANLRAALAASGQEVEKNTKKLVAFANVLQDQTVYGNDASEGLMAYATNLGVTANNMQAVVTAGIGLGKSLFGGDEKAGIEAVSKAVGGNFRELDRLLPAVRNAGSAHAKLNAVMKAGMQGFKQAQAETLTFWGSIKQLQNSVGDLAKGFGQYLLPPLEKALRFVRMVTDAAGLLSEGLKASIAKWVAIGAAVAGVLALAPLVVTFASGVIGAMTAIAGTMASLGGVMIAALFSPIGLIIGGFAAFVVGLAYFTGEGELAADRIASGFGKMWDVLNFTFGSWTNFKDMALTALDMLVSGVRKVWEEVVGLTAQAWSGLDHAIRDSLDTVWTTFKSWGMNLINFFERLWSQLRHGWGQMTNYLGDKIAKADLMLPKSAGGRGLSSEDADKAIASARKNTDGRDEAEYRKSTAAFNAEWSAAIAKIDGDWAERMVARGQQAGETQAKIAADMQRALDQIDADHSKRDADRTNDMLKNRSKTLSANLKTMLAGLAKSTGVDDAVKKFKSLQAEFEKLQKGKLAVPAMNAPSFSSKGGVGAFTDLQELSRQNLQSQFSQLQQDASNSAKMREQRALLDHQLALGENVKATRDLIAQLKRGSPMVLQ